jgi:4-amino-4-deoxy-L-arabinose transferase-like glycosyltransferase
VLFPVRKVSDVPIEGRVTPAELPGPRGSVTEPSAGVARLAWRPVGVVLLVDAALLAATVTRYGYHRDELYFRMLASHPAWGYVDEPPGTPMLAKAGIAVFGDNLWALRIPAMIFALAAVLMTALVAREFGGARWAQTLAAAGVSSTFLLVAGHVLLTATPDLVVWLGVILFACRALLRARPRAWLAAGVLAGAGMWNKQLIVLLLIGIGVGLILVGPRRELRSRWLWGGVAIAAVIALPNVLYQLSNSWPEVTMARTIAANKGHDDRVLFVPFQLILLGITVVPIWVAGLIRLLRDPRWRQVRCLTLAYPVVCVLVVVTAGQPYYTFGLLAFCYAAGCVVTERWAAGHRARWAWTWTAAAVTVAAGVLFALPVFPLRSLPPAIAAADQAERDTVGWPTYVHQVALVFRALPAADRKRTTVIAENYGEAGALDRFGPADGLPQVYSGQNQLYRYGPPPGSTDLVILVGMYDVPTAFTRCTQQRTLDNGVGIDNEEQGRPVSLCRGLRQPWTVLWPRFQHYG